MTVRRLENRVCIVTRAASGIGRAIAMLFAREGAQVIILDPGLIQSKVASAH